jgi:hypothetical protein
MHNENKSTQRWEISTDIGNVLFHKSSLFQDIAAYAKDYCATAMQARDSSMQHALICMGGDISSLFAIKAAIERGTIVFVISQTGKLANCIAEVAHMQKQSKQQSEIAASLAHILKRCTGPEEGVSDTGGVWLHVSIIQTHAFVYHRLISFWQLDGLQPEVFFSAISQAIMFISCCPLVHVLSISDAAVSAQFSRLLSEHKASRDCMSAPFPQSFQRCMYSRACSSVISRLVAACLRRAHYTSPSC